MGDMEVSVKVEGGARHTMTFDSKEPIGRVLRHVREIVEATRPKFEAVHLKCRRCDEEWTRRSEIGTVWGRSPFSDRLTALVPPGGAPTYVDCPRCNQSDHVSLAHDENEAAVPHWYRGSVALFAEADVVLRRRVDRHGEWFELIKSRDGIRLKANDSTRSLADLHLRSGDRVLVVQE